MSGPENIKGFDYQISYSLLKTLEILKTTNSIHSLMFESLGEEEEDFNIIGADFEEYHQLKKRGEGHHWTPGDLKEIFKKFISKDKGATKYYFITDGTANAEVKKLKLNLEYKEEIDEISLQTFLPEGESLENLKSIFKRTTLLTRFYASDDDKDPAKNLKAKILELLSKPPFEVKNTIQACYSLLWKLLFDYAREAQNIVIERIKSDFENAGLFIRQKPWFDTPEIGEFQGREIEVKTILAELIKANKLIIYGINGIGKTWISTKIVQETDPDSTCWIKINRWTSIDYVLFLVASLLYSRGYDYEAKQLQNLDISERVPKFIMVLEKIDITVVFDSINSGNSDINTYVEQLIEHSLKKKLLGKIIVTSTKRINSYTSLDVKNNNFSEYYLNGFTLEDTELILNTLNNKLSEEEIRKFHKAVGGHPMSIFFLKQLIGNKSISSDELSMIGTQTIETTRDWIIEKSIIQLPDRDREFLLKLSFLDGEILEDEIFFILEANTKPKYLLHNLHFNHLISYQNEELHIHDSIKEVAKNLLQSDYKFKIHEKLTSFYFNKMRLQEGSKDGVLYDDILKWGNQLEQLQGSNLLEEKYSTLLHLSNDQINALSAIKRFGYPFDFETEDLSSSELIIEQLFEKKFVEKNTNPEKKYMYSSVEFVLVNLDFWQGCFITYLCLSRNLPYHMGYIPIFQPNHSWHLQHSSCWWEHCIEFMPLPPITKSEKIKHQAFIKEQFEKGAYNDKTPDERSFLQAILDEGIPDDTPDEKDLEMEKSGCPIWGHCCPDGKEQASECRIEIEKSDDDQ
jgi:hypothetical protein